MPIVEGQHVPDVLEANVIEPLAATPLGQIHTGLAGSGCSINSTSFSTDPLLPGTALFAGLVLLLRRNRYKLKSRM